MISFNSENRLKYQRKRSEKHEIIKIITMYGRLIWARCNGLNLSRPIRDPWLAQTQPVASIVRLESSLYSVGTRLVAGCSLVREMTSGLLIRSISAGDVLNRPALRLRRVTGKEHSGWIACLRCTAAKSRAAMARWAATGVAEA